MKSLKFLILTVIIYMCNSLGFSQQSTVAVVRNLNAISVNSSKDENLNSKPDIAKDAVQNKMYRKAIRNFKKKYLGEENENWEILEEGEIIQDIYLTNVIRYVVRFTKDGKRVSITYDKRGDLVYELCSYKERQLPKEVRHIVKSVYYDYKITNVHELRMPTARHPIYLVHIEDQNEIIQLRIADSEMQEITSFDKSK